MPARKSGRNLKAKHLLESIDISQADLARQLGQTPAHVNQCLLGKRWSPTVAEAFKTATGVDLEEIFPNIREVAA